MRSVPPRARRVAAFLALGLLPAFLPTVSTPAVAGVALAEGVVRGTDSPDAIPGHYLVMLKPGAAVEATAQSVGDDRIERTFDGLGGFAARMSAVQARRLAADPSVSFVEQDRVVHVETTTQRNPGWNLDRIDQRKTKRSKTFTPTDDGSAVTAYVIDTGIRITHRDLVGRASYGYDSAGDGKVGDCNGHGTHVAGIIGGTLFGVAKKVHLVAVRVLDCRGDGDLESVIAGVNWVTKHAVKPAVANMSLGAERSAALDIAVARSIASGVTYTVAAGNEDSNAKKSSPADVSTAITVGASDSKDKRAKFSNFGSGVDLFAPGVNIWSDYGLGNTMVARMSGTSMAAPLVAGAAALLLDANPTWSPRTVRDYLVRTASAAHVSTRGARSPNRLLFIPAPPKAPVVRTIAVAIGAVGVAYRSQLALTASRRGAWRVFRGSLPAGLHLSTTGLLYGTPTAAGSWPFVVGFTDFVPTTGGRAITVTVRATPPSITTTSIPSGTAGSAYTTQLTVAGGRIGTWSTVDGSLLPAGLTLSATGDLSGTPLAAGTFSVAVRFTDGWNQATTRILPLTVA